MFKLINEKIKRSLPYINIILESGSVRICYCCIWGIFLFSGGKNPVRYLFLCIADSPLRTFSAFPHATFRNILHGGHAWLTSLAGTIHQE